MNDAKELHKQLNRYIFDKDYSGARDYVRSLSAGDVLALHDLASSYALRATNLAALVEDVRFEQNHHGGI